ncbi:MAG: hypothetical protein Q9166_002463 [cf. Caloplaca sp. 2 TL-2023]
MDDCADIIGKYQDQLRPEDIKDAHERGAEIDLAEEFSNISLDYERKAVEKRYYRGYTLANTMRMAKSIVENPKRLVWVAFDEELFVKLVGRLTELNDFLQELLHGHQARKLEQVTEKTYMEMVQVRSSVEDLKQLVTAAMLLGDHGHSPKSEVRRRSDEILAKLADFKSLNAANEAPTSQKPPEYESIISATSLNYSQVYYQEDLSSSTSRYRAQGKFYPGDETERYVWVEWRTYKEKWDPGLDKFVPERRNRRRVRELVALLQSAKPAVFCAPRCLGYFNDRDDVHDSEHDFRFGLVFEKPVQDHEPVSLQDLLSDDNVPTPSLTARLSLAHKLSVCVLYLHAVSWLHKSLRSDSLMFFPPAYTKNDITDPYLTGYAYARADRPSETTTSVDFDEWTELYVHPDYQCHSKLGTYRKTFDIYSLGIVLLEIAFWRPIEDIMELDMDADNIYEDIHEIRDNILTKKPFILEAVRVKSGDRYCIAVKSCIQGREAFGIEPEEKESDVETSAKLQSAFTRSVTENLEGIDLYR